MSDTDTKENKGTGEGELVDALDKGQLEYVEEMDCNPNSSSDSVESEPVQETLKPAENGESIPDGTDIVVTGDDKNNLEPQSTSHQPDQDLSPSSVPLNGDGEQLDKPDTETLKGDDHQVVRPDTEAQDLPQSDNHDSEDGNTVSTSHPETAEPTDGAKSEVSQLPEAESGGPVGDTATVNHIEPVTPHAGPSNAKVDTVIGEELKSKVEQKVINTPQNNGNSKSKCSLPFENSHMSEGNDSGTEEDQLAFMKEVEKFFRERKMEFKPLKFYGEALNYLKLWRAVTKLGGYDKVTLTKLWKQVGETFRPPKTCTTVSYTFRGFYEKALLDYERHKLGTEPVPISSKSEPMNIDDQPIGSGRARRDAAARAMQGWHSQRLLDNGEFSDPIIKDKSSTSLQKREKQLKSIGLLKRKQPPCVDDVEKAARTKTSKTQMDADVVDLGPPADWVKINVQKSKDCFEVYALVPGLLREEVRVQSDPSGRLIISGEPEHTDNPWGVTPFKKVVNLPSKIDPHQTTAVVTLHGQLFVRVPFGESE